jgi:beta-glucosidase
MPDTRRAFLTSSSTAVLMAALSRSTYAQAAAAMQSNSTVAFGALEVRQSLTPEQIDRKAHALLTQLSLDEKISMMSGALPFFQGLYQMSIGGYNRFPLTVAWAIPRLGIPGVRFTDGPRGVMLPAATTFPVSMARGASFDPQLEQRIGDAMGREARANGANMIGAVCINLLRHPAWGRAQETYGEDSYHLGAMGVALTHGIQGHVMACAKHFALNSMENARFKVDVTADPRTLHEVYLPHFKRVVDADVSSVMSSYNSLNGEWAGQNKVLLTDILQKMWGFQGYVQSDWVFGMRDAKKAALAGQHLEMPTQNVFARFLPDLVARGEVPVAVIDDAALRILRQQVRFGQGRDPKDYTADVIGCEAHRRLAREAAQKGIVLLKNEGNALPLTGIRNIAVCGRLADTPNIGDHGSSSTQPAYVVTPLRGLQSSDAPINIAYEDGSDLARAAAAAKFADAAICVVGYTYLDEGEYFLPESSGPWTAHFPKPTQADAPVLRKMAEYKATQSAKPFGGDRNSLALHPEDEALILAVTAANPRTIVAIMSGSAVITEAWRDKAAAILMLWYPGMEGGRAFADVVLGHINPSGKLPCTFPRRAEDLPFFDKDATQITYDLWHGYRKLDRDGVAPAFPFGFGLSYTTFALSNLQLAKDRIRAGENLMVTADLTNTGTVAGEEVVQLYVGARSSKVPRAKQELKGFTRVALNPGEKRSISFPSLPPNSPITMPSEGGSSSRGPMRSSSVAIRAMTRPCGQISRRSEVTGIQPAGYPGPDGGKIPQRAIARPHRSRTAMPTARIVRDGRRGADGIAAFRLRCDYRRRISWRPRLPVMSRKHRDGGKAFSKLVA